MHRNRLIHGHVEPLRFRHGIGFRRLKHFEFLIELARRMFLFCSHEVNQQNRRFTPPWRVEEETAETFIINDASGTKVA